MSKIETESKNDAPAGGRPEGLAETTCSARNFALHVPAETKAILKVLAAASKMTLAQYVVVVLNEAVGERDVFNLGRDDARIYPCDNCGTLRTKTEGGTTFTVCDSCWDTHHKQNSVI